MLFVLWTGLSGCEALRWEPTPAGSSLDTAGVVLPDTGEGICPEYQGGGVVTWYRDADEDGWGRDDDWELCDVQPGGFVAPRTHEGDWSWDCDDDDPEIHPEGTETCNDGLDQDCDGQDSYERTYYYDDDGDGHVGQDGTRVCDPGDDGRVSRGDDCDDTDPEIHPYADEVCGDGVDQDCDGADYEGEPWFADGDVDGWGGESAGEACDQPTGTVGVSGDCDDGRADVHPDAEEICGDGLDNDCVGGDDAGPTWYPDDDGDSYASLAYEDAMQACERPEGWLSGGRDDCDDTDPDVNPGVLEVCGDGVDNDCDGSSDMGDAWFADSDGDGWGDIDTSVTACSAPSGFVANDEDCLDTDATVSPDGVEVCGDGLDNDCNDGDDVGDTWYADGDGDGFGGSTFSTVSCDAPSGFVDNLDDCDDLDAEVSPDAVEVCGDGVDNDCDNAVLSCGVWASFSTGEADEAWYGETTLDAAGGAVASVGDVDGDGVGELLVGAEHEDSGAYGGGVAYLLGAGDASLSSARAVLPGEASSDGAGVALAGGDLDGDGWPDLVVGAAGQDEGATNGGAAYVIWGPVTGQVLLADADLVVLGDVEDEELGAWIATSGDQDGDGADELGAGAASAGAGRVVLVAGGASGDVEASDALARLDGDVDGDEFGAALDGGRDVDGDGLDDWLVGAPAQDGGAGAAHLFHGPVIGDVHALDAYASWTVGTSDRVGESVALVPDSDGDGLADALIAAPSADPTSLQAGSVYLVLGSAMGAVDLSDAVARIDGPSGTDYLGRVLGSCADITGDGLDELVVGTQSGWSSQEGIVYVLTEAPEGTAEVSDIAAGSLYGGYYDQVGPFGCPGDWSGDGIGDIALGAPGDDTDSTTAGAVYLFYGGEGL